MTIAGTARGTRIRWAAVVLGCAVLLNTVTFCSADQSALDRWRALEGVHSDDILSLVLDTEGAKSLYSISIALREFAPDSTLLLVGEAQAPMDRVVQRYYGLGRARHVLTFDSPLIALEDIGFLEGMIVASDEGGRRGEPYFLALDPGVPAGEHVLVQVVAPSAEPAFSHQVGLVDVTLLGHLDREELRPWS